MSEIHDAKLLAHGEPLHTGNPEDITGIPFLSGIPASDGPAASTGNISTKI